MFDAKALANAGAVVAVILYVVCALVVLVFPDLLFNLFALTAHGVNLEPLRPQAANLNFSNVVGGAIVYIGLTWITLYGFGYFYNKFRK